MVKSWINILDTPYATMHHINTFFESTHFSLCGKTTTSEKIDGVLALYEAKLEVEEQTTKSEKLRNTIRLSIRYINDQRLQWFSNIMRTDETKAVRAV